MNLQKIIDKIREVALDLREIKHPSEIGHQANKLDEVVEKLEAMSSDDLDITPNVHGSGTGRD